MGDLLGLPEWLAKTIFVMLVLAGWIAVGFYLHRKAQRCLAVKRPNPTREEFLAMMGQDIDPDIAEWMWDQLQVYYTPLTPHPDDHLLKDACIDDGDVTMDWLPEFAKTQGLPWRRWPDWPEGRDLTVHNFARWLQLGRDELQR